MMPTWITQPAGELSTRHRDEALARQGQLTKPPGSLGRLEELGVRLATMQQTQRPHLDKAWISVFAADHGIAAAGVSAFPQSVTLAMIHNFSAGGAAISVLASALDAALEVVDVGALTDPSPLPRLVSHRAGPGTADFRQQPAMTPEQLITALEAGRGAVSRARGAGARIFIGGEMGIGNTTAATAILCALCGMDPHVVTGPGTGLAPEGVSRKAEVIATALAHHWGAMNSPLEVLRHVGGFEIAALAGAFITAGQVEMPVLVDGFIAGAAALVAVAVCPSLRPWLFIAHRSAEPGHGAMLEALGEIPLLDLGLRLGEGSGAATALPILRLACALHGGMATFAEAGVAGKER